MKKVHVFLSSTILLISCITLAPTPAPQPTYEPIPRIPTTDPSQPIEVQAGEDFQIVIDANPTTGYHWEILGELDAGIVEFVSREYNNDEPVTVGSGGVDIWTFKALFAGTAQITLGSYPPSLDPTGPEGTVTFTVSIH